MGRDVREKRSHSRVLDVHRQVVELQPLLPGIRAAIDGELPTEIQKVPDNLKPGVRQGRGLDEHGP
jgi:hypothetical protein